MSEIFDVIDEDIFDNVSQAVAVVWWLVHISGGKVYFPVEEQFWLDNFSHNSRLKMAKEDGKLVLIAE